MSEETDEPAEKKPARIPAWMEPLRKDYGRRLPELAAEVEAACRLEGGTLADSKAAYLASHRLAGTSATYGFDAVGEACRTLEDLVRDGGEELAGEVVTENLRVIREAAERAAASVSD